MKFKRKKYTSGVQNITNDSPDNSKLYNYQANIQGSSQLGKSVASTAANLYLPGSGTAAEIIDSTTTNLFKNDKGVYKNDASKVLDTNLNPLGAVGKLTSGDFAGLYEGSVLGLGLTKLGVKNPFGKSQDYKMKEIIEKEKIKTRAKNANKQFSGDSNTDAMSYAKKGKYKVKGRVIETEGREPIFSPKKADGSRDLLYFNPNDPTHNEGGVKIAVTKKACGSKNMKYKKGTSAIKAVIPEGSSIITADKGMNIKALNAYKRGDHKTLDKIINSMPEDKSSKKDGGSRWTIATDPTEDNIKGELGNTVKLRKAIQAAIQAGDYNKAQKLGGYLDKNKNWVYKNPNKKYKGKEELAAKNNYTDITPMENKVPKFNTSNNVSSDSNPSINKVETKNQKEKTPFDISSIPSLAEITARQSLLNKGVDKVPENYVKFGRYKYASQLPKVLAENTMDANTAKQNARNLSGGNVSNYLANSSNIYTNKLKANNEAVMTDTLARQDVLNKNVDVANNEIQINTGLKNEFNNQKAQNLGAYRNQVIVQGQSIDSTLDSAKKESWAKKRDSQLLDILKTRNYNYSEDSGITLSKKGLKNVKKYKTTRK